MSKTALFLAAGLASGCAFTAQTARLAPTATVQSSNVGQGAAVYVQTVDERPSDVVGNRGVGGNGAEIKASTAELVSVVNSSMVDGLGKLGFAPTLQRADGLPELRVEVRALDYKVAQGFWAGSLDVDAALKAICIRGDQRPHEQLHRGHYEDSIQVIQGADNNDTYINSALSKAIGEVLHDRPLMDCLAAGAGTRSAAATH
jgi:uncharacterized lipoprotein